LTDRAVENAYMVHRERVAPAEHSVDLVESFPLGTDRA
jgi:hypothetical protein